LTAAAAYYMIAQHGVFSPVPAVKGGEKAAKAEMKQAVEKPAVAKKAEAPKAEAKKAEAKKPEPKKAEPKKAEPKKPAPEPVKKVEAPVPVVPPQPTCSAITLSLFDVQAMARNPSMRFVDVRSPEKYAAGHVEGAINIPLADFENAFARAQATLSTGAGIVLYGEDSNDEAPLKECLLMSGRMAPHLYNFREGWSRWNVPAQ